MWESSWGCTDELGPAQCASLPHLFLPSSYDTNDHGAPSPHPSCRWPAAELCLNTCGQCHLVKAAKKCTSLLEECQAGNSNNDNNNNNLDFCSSSPDSQDETVDWEKWFTSLTTSSPFRIISHSAPWVAEYPNFLTTSEVTELLRISAQEGYRDEDELPKHVRDVSVTNCDSIRCMTEPFMNELYGRISNLLGFPANNFESMEFISYGPKQHYRWHSDEYSWKYPPKEADPVAVLSGPRVLTMFFYLSNVTEGGETVFAGEDTSGNTKRLAVTPERGKMILWANMKDEWRVAEPAAVHAAAPVRKGRKYAATIWIHASGFRVPELYAGRECHSRQELFAGL